MSRTNARKNAFYLVFQHDFVGAEGMDEAKDVFYSENEDIDDTDRNFINSAVNGTLENLESIDAVISEAAKGWTIERMAKVDLAILRLAVYELKFSSLTPEKVVINEAVELAKKYSSDNAPAFVNGVLGKIAGGSE
ncbi:transcription antitermination factor NusB [Lachnospiraceae bacterium NSJ-143]|nr:transcription antitermination factor NusB [Lachnospiraceae bacterium NSJ-143]